MAVTADVKGTAILRNKVADYLNTEPGGESPAYHLMNVFETIDENPNAQVVEKHYTSDKAATKLTSGYAPQFPITGDQYLDNDVSEFIRDIAEEQQIGVGFYPCPPVPAHRQQGEYLLCAQVPRVRGSLQHHRCRRRDHLPGGEPEPDR